MKIAEPQTLTPKRTEHGKAVRKAYESGLPTQQMLEVKSDGISNTLTTVQKDNVVVERPFRIRKLTPLECWRLMGFADEDFCKAEQVNSNSQLYKQAGNSIVVDVLMAIFGQMIIAGDKPAE